jgi:hypothetical protein
MNSYQTWHQIAVNFKVKEKADGLHMNQIAVFEKRECDIDPYDAWRLCYLDRAEKL